MKNLLILTSLLISGSLWADMDYTCDAFINDSMTDKNKEAVEKFCERNNIFRAYGFDEEGLHLAIAQYCRFDRQIEFYRSEKKSSMREEFYYLNCVLYDNEPREFIKEPDY